MTNVPLALGLAAIELTVLFGVTVRAFGAEARLIRDREDDLARARAALEAVLLEQVGALIESVRRIKRFTESYTDALFRSDWTEDVRKIGDLGSGLGVAPRRFKRLIWAWRVLAWVLVLAHIAAPAFLLNNILGREALPDIVDTGAAYVFAGAALAAVIAAAWVRQADLAFERCLRELR